MEAALKLSRQYFLEVKPQQPQRTRFISRERSYHGITLGALAVGGHKFRRANFEPLLMKNVSQVSPCFEYRGKGPRESDEDYVQRLAQELDDEFQRVGPETVCAFVAEPVVGAVRISLTPFRSLCIDATTIGSGLCAFGARLLQGRPKYLPKIRSALDLR